MVGFIMAHYIIWVNTFSTAVSPYQWFPSLSFHFQELHGKIFPGINIVVPDIHSMSRDHPKQIILPMYGQVNSSLMLRHKDLAIYLISFHYAGILSFHMVTRRVRLVQWDIWERYIYISFIIVHCNCSILLLVTIIS